LDLGEVLRDTGYILS
jgi:hypothetical protein